MDLQIRRNRQANEAVWKKAMKVPPEAKMKKVKNISTDGLTKEKTGKIHLGVQNLADLDSITKKQKARVFTVYCFLYNYL